MGTRRLTLQKQDNRYRTIGLTLHKIIGQGCSLSETPSHPLGFNSLG